MRAGFLVGLAVTLAAAAVPMASARTVMDALFYWDEFNARHYTILNCHPGVSAEDAAYLAKGDALEKAAFDELMGQLNRDNPGKPEENAKAAANQMAYRRKLREFSISEQIRNYGCDWLDEQYRLANR